MRIVKLWDADYPWDVRVEKIVTSLVKDGHEVHLVCRNKRMDSTYEYLNGLHIHRLPLITRSRKINESMSFPAFFSPFWIRWANKVIRKVKPDVVLVRDLPLCLTAWYVARLNNVPVVMDMAEDYPEQCKNVWKLKGFRLRNMILRNPLLAELIERISITLVDHIIVVVEESRQRLLELNVPDHKLTVVSNTPVSYSIPEQIPSVIAEGFTGLACKTKLVYLGILDENRGVTTVLKSLPEIKKKIQDIVFVVIGQGSYEQELNELAIRLNVQDLVRFLGWIDHTVVRYYLLACDIGVIPHHAIPGWHATIPNKLFDYMQLGKPVIVSNARATARIVAEEQCGLVFRSEDTKSFVDAVVSLKDVRLRHVMGSNGRRSVLQRYNWELDLERLVGALKAVLSRS